MAATQHRSETKSETEPALTEQQADAAQSARQKQREADDAAFRASIEGQEVPPSYAEQEKVDAKRAADAKKEQAAAAKDLAESTARISSSGSQPTGDAQPSPTQVGQDQS